MDNEDCADAQADLSLRWAHMSDGTFLHVAALIIKICPFWYKRCGSLHSTCTFQKLLFY